jgi:DNA mismatch endonuclease (patch repair protein)
MARVRSRDTEPELRLRRLLTARGVRYRLHRADLPGRPDVFVPRLKLAIFVNGCFWHGHDCTRGQRPSRNASWWATKIEKNAERDRVAQQALLCRGLQVRVLWTCSVGDFERTADEVAGQYAREPQRRDSTS